MDAKILRSLEYRGIICSRETASTSVRRKIELLRICLFCFDLISGLSG